MASASIPPSARFDHGIEYAGLSHVGHVRANNEDLWRADAELSLFAIADGMGGHQAGEVAAATCLDTFFTEMKSLGAMHATQAFLRAPSIEGRRSIFNVLRRAAECANDAVRAEALKIGAKEGIGCTLDAALLVGDRAFVVHVGDSRVYLARAAATIQLTHDHDLRAVLAAEGRLAPTQRASIYNQLLNAIGLNAALTTDCTLVELAQGDRLVLCTDGVHEMIGGESLIAPFAKKGTPADAAQALIDAALARGGRDNATALVIEVSAPVMPRKETQGAARDFTIARACPLLCDLADALVLRALAMAAEVEIDEGKTIPRVVTTDHVAYIVLDGEAEVNGISLGASALLYAESLLGMGRNAARFRAVSRVRCLRLRADDFGEVCADDPRLAAALYERLARHLATYVR